MSEKNVKRRRRSHAARRREAAEPVKQPPVWPGVVGGRYQPLTQNDMERIHQTALDLLEKIGFADATPSMIDTVVAAGG